jgi:hypothetical protein
MVGAFATAVGPNPSGDRPKWAQKGLMPAVPRSIGSGAEGVAPGCDAFRGQSSAPQPHGPNRLSALPAHFNPRREGSHSLRLSGSSSVSISKGGRSHKNETVSYSSGPPPTSSRGHPWPTFGSAARRLSQCSLQSRIKRLRTRIGPSGQGSWSAGIRSELPELPRYLATDERITYIRLRPLCR